jgi:hypothetical protein
MASCYAFFSSLSLQRAIARHQLVQAQLLMTSSLSMGLLRSQLIEELEREVASQEEGDGEDDDV